ncbi:hypothetical protein ARMGADRAFT_1027333 [Armillaria gallica]|uniref:Uncharacterized protein n=1 Tax=Armillaria gallica TaxID=47427 RepID=A0A2H3DV56_ARMGA|nr:hypothetical protein ARMGADRAFT_1027333 [Armillaria gallica]
MRAYMVEMEEEGVLEPVDEKCSQCHGGRRCLLPVDSDNGHPACAECLISSHGCPNRIARATPAKKKATHSDKGKGKAGPAPVKRPQAFVLVPRLKPNSHPPAAGEPAQPEAGPSNMPTPLDFMVEFQSFHSRPMQERPPTGHNPVTDFAFNLAEHCLGGMTHPREAAWDRILALTHQLIAAHRALEYELRERGGKRKCLRVPLGRPDFLGGRIDNPALSNSQRALLAILLQRRGGNPSWADNLGGHSALGTLRLFDMDNGIALKEEEVDFLIDRQYLHTIEEP